MSGFNHSQGQGPKQNKGPQPKKGQKQKSSPAVKRAQQFDRDKLRQGAVWQRERLLENESETEQCADDHLLKLPTEDNLPDDLAPQAMSEIPLTDEDDFDESEDMFYPPGSKPEDSPTDMPPWEQAVIAVVGDRAVFQIPDWAQSFVEPDLDLCWETYAKVADWLTRDRRDFLRNPSYRALAGSPVDLNPPICVTKRGLHQRLGLRCDESTFGKHATVCRIVWPNRQLPLADLWSHEATLAWCAQAAIQRQNKRGYVPRSGEFGRGDIQPPGASAERQTIIANAGRGWQLGPVPFVQLLCVLTKCKWRDVLDRYGEAIFYKG